MAQLLLRLKIGIIKSIFLLLPFVALSSCAPPVTNTPMYSQNEVRQEAAIQQNIYNQNRYIPVPVKSNTPNRVRLLETSKRINAAGMSLCGRIIKNRDNCVYDVVLSRKRGINAYADGRRIHITYDMMNFASSDVELATVIAHEYAHNLLGHVANTQKNVMAGALVGLLIDGVAASQGYNTKSQFTEMGAGIGRLSYSQDYEKEADYVGLYIMHLAGYDISSAPYFWRKMSIKNPDSISFSSTHPSNSERFIALERTVQEILYKRASNAPMLPNIRPTQNR